MGAAVRKRLSGAVRMQPFFATTVSPYFTQPAVTWPDIQRDKQAYFDRFPQIHYTIVGTQQRTLDNGNLLVDLTLAYDEIRKDGRSFTGRSQERMILRNIGGSPKIVGIEEQKIQ